MYKTDDERSHAVRANEKSADGTFLFAIRRTGIFCIPSCPSRALLRDNVECDDDGQSARRDGFRACKRFRPDGQSAVEAQAAATARICRHNDASEAMPTLGVLGQAAGLSAHHLHRIFKRVTGLAPRSYTAERRADMAREELGTGPLVKEAVYAAGFNVPNRFNEAADGMFGIRPSTDAAGWRGEIIHFAVGESALGSILVASTARGVCAILFGDDSDALARDLQDRFPNAEIVGTDAGLERLVATAVGTVESPSTAANLPLDIRGTAFQQRVWQALRDLSPGDTVSYGEVARRIGEPGASRAVAQACGANSLAVVIPCHRVVRTDGALSGYRWGVERKRELLRREAQAA